jgi:hypothetical protein
MKLLKVTDMYSLYGQAAERWHQGTVNNDMM